MRGRQIKIRIKQRINKNRGKRSRKLSCGYLFPRLCLFGKHLKKEHKQVFRLSRQIVTFGAGFTAVPWEQDGIIAVQVRTVLFDILTVYFPKHLATTTFLLPEGRRRRKKTDTSVSHKISSENTQ